MNGGHAQFIHAFLQDLAGPPHQFPVAFLQHIQQRRHLAQIDLGKISVMFADVPGVVDEVGELDGLGAG